ncbi:MAG: efflux RND transporter periplasmic adaptor subunit [Patescibacteria group bacterium]
MVKILAYARTHKVIVGLAFTVLCGGGYWAYSAYTTTAGETRFVLGTVKKGTIVASVSASGQVSASSQLDIKPKASGEIISIRVTSGQKVGPGTLIAVLDPTSAQKSVRDAESNLESAKLSLEKIKRPADTLSLIQSENSLAQATVALGKAYDDGFNSVADSFLDLPTIMAGQEDILYGKSVNPSGSQNNLSAYTDMVDGRDLDVLVFRDDAVAKYKKARDEYDVVFLAYRAMTRNSSREAIESIIDKTYAMARTVADSVKSTHDFLGFVKDKIIEQNASVPSALTADQTENASYIADANSSLTALLNLKETIASAKYSITEKTESLAELKAGSDALDIKSAELTLKQRENSLLDAKHALADYYVYAPFAGTIATLSAKKYDTAGSGTAIATLITSQKIAELSLNEVDATKVSLGDKTTLSFDAIEDFTLTGEVAEIDAIGTVTQGVVSYKIKVRFDSQDERIKSGMTANAAIQIETRQDVLVVPSGAVKTQNGVSRVQVFNPALVSEGGAQGVVSKTPPTDSEVVVGISDDSSVEIVSGLEEGQQIVTRTISTAATAAATTGSAAPRGGGGFGGPPGIRF